MQVLRSAERSSDFVAGLACIPSLTKIASSSKVKDRIFSLEVVATSSTHIKSTMTEHTGHGLEINIQEIFFKGKLSTEEKHFKADGNDQEVDLMSSRRNWID
jgi:hypothetical protein